MNHATAPIELLSLLLEDPNALSYEEFLTWAAKDCRNCPNCGNPPCGACTAGGICDQSDCYCGDALHDEPYEAQGLDDLDAEGELP